MMLNVVMMIELHFATDVIFESYWLVLLYVNMHIVVVNTPAAAAVRVYGSIQRVLVVTGPGLRVIDTGNNYTPK